MDQQESFGLAPLDRLSPSPAAISSPAKHSPDHARYFFGADATGGIDMATRVFDVFFAIGAIVFFAPLMLLTAFAVAVTIPGPVLFAHKRIG